MPQLILYMDEKENEKIIKFSKKWDLSKLDTVKRIIKEYDKHE